MEESAAKPRSNRLRDVAVAVVIGLVVVGVVYALNSGAVGAGGPSSVDVAPAGPAPQIGKPAADFSVKELDGTTVHLSDFKGKPVWLNFWATWCPPCRAEIPDINAVYNEEKGKGLVLLALSIGEDSNTVQQYVKKAQMPFTIGLDGNESVAGLYRVSGIPTHIFIDRQGVIRDIQIGGMSRDLMMKKLSKIL